MSNKIVNIKVKSTATKMVTTKHSVLATHTVELH